MFFCYKRKKLPSDVGVLKNGNMQQQGIQTYWPCMAAWWLIMGEWWGDTFKRWTPMGRQTNMFLFYSFLI